MPERPIHIAMDEVACAMFGALAICVLLQIRSFAAGRQEARLVSERVLCLEDKVDRLGREVKTVLETLRGLLCAEDSARPRKGRSRRGRKRAGDGGSPLHNKADTQDAGVSEPPPPDEETEPEPESESESERGVA